MGIVSSDILFEVQDYAGIPVRTTYSYWQKIRTEKHKELNIEYTVVMETIRHPDEVYQSVQDAFIKLFYRKFEDKYAVVLVKYLGTVGFVVTCYQTVKTKRKGEKLWPM